MKVTTRINPLKLPMGWNAKAIPYWVIQTSWPRTELQVRNMWQSQLLCRSACDAMSWYIHNSKSFNEITSAQKLWEKERVFKWHPDEEEEYSNIICHAINIQI